MDNDNRMSRQIVVQKPVVVLLSADNDMSLSHISDYKKLILLSLSLSVSLRKWLSLSVVVANDNVVVVLLSLSLSLSRLPLVLTEVDDIFNC